MEQTTHKSFLYHGIESLVTNILDASQLGGMVQWAQPWCIAPEPWSAPADISQVMHVVRVAYYAVYLSSDFVDHDLNFADKDDG